MGRSSHPLATPHPLTRDTCGEPRRPQRGSGALGVFFARAAGASRRSGGPSALLSRRASRWWFSLGKQTSSSTTSQAPSSDRRQGCTHLLRQRAAAPSVWKSCASTGGPVRVSEQRRERARSRRYRCCLADGFVSGAGRRGEKGWRGACRTTATTTTAATTTKRLAPREGSHRPDGE